MLSKTITRREQADTDTARILRVRYSYFIYPQQLQELEAEQGGHVGEAWPATFPQCPSYILH